MRCRKIISYLNAYVDGELPERQRPIVEAHLAKCAVCLKRLEDIRSLEGSLNDTLHVPSVPDGFVTRVMREARRIERPEATMARPFPPMGWNPLRWITELSAPMRIAACVTMLLACIVGLTMDGGLILDKQGQVSRSAKNLHGLEWFEPTPSGSIGSIYIAMAAQTNEEGNGQ